ncbi:thiamine pyrophosphate-dependent dehydrogenase E1 component subunit alpha [Thermoleophilia bacterium SCSIO 60948]|nr:thiamine pyrophosphate-dependent dehydrogenase E1 component subunit alpha [Thermoleophilia bacterium SCSIO 60948]
MGTSDARAIADGPSGVATPGLERADRAGLLRHMLLMRKAEERGLRLYKQGKIPGSFYDGRGQEAIPVGSSWALAPEDRMCILHRDLGAHFVRGVTPDRYLANYMGRSGGVTGGKDGNLHFGDPELGCVGMVSMLPDMALVAMGMALAFKQRGEARVAMTYFGEGSTANGQWHEAMNMAGVQELPVVFILENNGFAYSTPNDLEFAADPVDRASGYGFDGVHVDGNDVEAVFGAATEAVERARAGGGPTLIGCRTMRMNGHGAHDDHSYVPESELEAWGRRDPIERYRDRLAAEFGFSHDELGQIAAEVDAEIEAATEKALASPMPDPSLAFEGVYATESRRLGDGRAPWTRWSRDRDAERGHLRSRNGRSAGVTERSAA